MDQRFTVMMEALKTLTDKRKYREEEHVAAQTIEKGPELRLRAQKSSRKQVTK